MRKTPDDHHTDDRFKANAVSFRFFPGFAPPL